MKKVLILLINLLLLNFNLLCSELTLNKVIINGNYSFSRSSILKHLNLRPLPFYKKIMFWQNKPLFVESLMRQDEQNIIKYLQSNGFLYAELDSKIIKNSKNRVSIEYTLIENQPVLVNEVNIIIDDSIFVKKQLNKKNNQKLLKKEILKSSPNEIFRDKNIFHDVNLINNTLINQGFLKSQTEYEVNFLGSVDSLQTKVNVNYKVYPENLYFFNSFNLIGDFSTSDKTIKRQLSLSDSLIYKSNIVSDYQYNLFRLGVFRSVQVNPNFVENSNIVIPTITLIEQPKWVGLTGIGWGSEDRFRTTVQVNHHNVLNMADQQNLSMKTSYLEPWNIQFRWIQPAFIRPKLILTINPFIKRENSINYKLDKFGNIITFTYPFLRNWGINFSHILEQNKLSDIKIQDYDKIKSIYNQSTFFSQLDVNYSSPKSNPQHGYHFISGAGIAGVGFNSPYDYYFLSQELRYYKVIHDLFVLAIRNKIQTMEEIFNSPEIPIENRLYLGGMQSIRGRKKDTVSPVNDSNQIIGGRTSFLINLESRVPIVSNLSISFLFDTGYVSKNSYEFDIAQLSSSAGIGLRYFSPIGILRLDFARSITNDFSPVRFYLTIGEVF